MLFQASNTKARVEEHRKGEIAHPEKARALTPCHHPDSPRIALQGALPPPGLPTHGIARGPRGNAASAPAAKESKGGSR
eukprot:7526032-Alexandrium_andersonii.AAC.1